VIRHQPLSTVFGEYGDSITRLNSQLQQAHGGRVGLPSVISPAEVAEQTEVTKPKSRTRAQCDGLLSM
jgi:hypothetical protein